jgi:hypothetical protein
MESRREPLRIFEAVFEHSPVVGEPPVRTVVACFTTKTDADDFCRKVNDEEQCTVLEVEDVACVDDYGFPVTRAEYAQLFPHRFT